MRGWDKLVHTVVAGILVLGALLSLGFLAPAARAQEECSDFFTQSAAQGHMDRFPESSATLDSDGNGLACEDLPAPAPTPSGVTTSAEEGGAILDAADIDIAGDAKTAIEDASVGPTPVPTPASMQEAQAQMPDLNCADFLRDDREIAQAIYDEMTEDSDEDARAVELILDPDGNDVPCDHDEFSPTKPKEPLIGALAAPPADAQPITLNGYLDGEMIKARVGDQQETIRMIGVDTPDVERWECLSFDALDTVRAIMPQDATYYIEFSPRVTDGDGRLYAYLWYPAMDGWRLLSETLLAEGLAGYVEPDWEHSQYTGSLRTAVENAEAADLGIWGQCGGSWHEEVSPCVTVDPVIVDYISSNLDAGLWLRNAQAVRSPAFIQVHLVAGDIEGPGMEGDGDIGVWWMPGGPDAASAQLQLIESLDGYAPRFSVFPEHGTLASMEATGYDRAMQCVREAPKADG